MTRTYEKGTWLFVAGAAFGANASGYRQVWVGSTEPSELTSRLHSSCAAASPSDNTVLNAETVLNLSYETDIHVRVRHNAGSALDVYPGLTAVRIR